MSQILSYLTGEHNWWVVVTAALVIVILGTKAYARFRNQGARLDTALNSMRQGLLMFDSESRLILCNRRYSHMYGISPKPGCTLREILQQRKVAGSFSGDPDQYIAKFVDKGRIESKAVDLPDGRIISVTNAPVRSGGWVSTHDDITERRSAEKERDRTKTFLSTVIENVPVTIIVKDARDRRYVLVNRYGEGFYGMSRDDMIGKTAYDFFPKEEADAMTAHDDAVLLSGEELVIQNNPVHLPRKGWRVVTTKRLAILGDNGEPQYLLCVIEDVTERKRAEERIAHMAHHDALTDLPNRAAFNERLACVLNAATTAGGSFAVCCVDLDRFKEVNDLFGHLVGDALLREVSRRLQTAAEGAFLARLGGDEFTLIAPDGPQPSTAAVITDRLQAAVADEIDIGGRGVRTGLSIGVAIFPTDGTDAATLLANADAALYRAKAEGRGTIRFFEADMAVRLRDRRALQHDLRSASAHGELTLDYQPQARITGEIIGFEALARWHHPTRGLVPPTTFIPLAEESGLMGTMGEWILRETCREAASWPQPLQIAINLSPIQFRQGDLVGLIHSVLLETGLAPSRLELEITEGVLIDDFSHAVSILRRLKTLGVRVALDDFGTGYSSLSYLQSFPFDKIKIDLTFVSNLDRNPQSAAIIRGVIGLAKGVDLLVVAEGVETKEQLAFLSREGCVEIQGYLVGRPGPIDDYADVVGRPATARQKPVLLPVA